MIEAKNQSYELRKSFQISFPYERKRDLYSYLRHSCPHSSVVNLYSKTVLLIKLTRHSCKLWLSKVIVLFTSWTISVIFRRVWRREKSRRMLVDTGPIEIKSKLLRIKIVLSESSFVKYRLIRIVSVCSTGRITKRLQDRLPDISTEGDEATGDPNSRKVWSCPFTIHLGRNYVSSCEDIWYESRASKSISSWSDVRMSKEINQNIPKDLDTRGMENTYHMMQHGMKDATTAHYGGDDTRMTLWYVRIWTYPFKQSSEYRIQYYLSCC